MKLQTLFSVAVAAAALVSAAGAQATASSTAAFSGWEGASSAPTELRHILVGAHRLDAGVSLPSGVVRPGAGGPTAFLCFTTTTGGTDYAASYDIQTGAWSLDDQRQPLGRHGSASCFDQLKG